MTGGWWGQLGEWQSELSGGIKGAQTLYPRTPVKTLNEDELWQTAGEHAKKARPTLQGGKGAQKPTHSAPP